MNGFCYRKNEILIPLLSFCFLFFTGFSALKAQTKVLTNIILINGEAMLVDMDERGEILKRHIYVADYFTSKLSHENLVKRSIDLLKDVGSLTDDNKADYLVWERIQSHMISPGFHNHWLYTGYFSRNPFAIME